MRNIAFKHGFFLALYYGFARYLPSVKIGATIRYMLCRRIFKYCGKHVIIKRNVYFGSGQQIEIGDHSEIGENAIIPSNTKIGKDVLIAANCRIISMNHRFDRIDIPIREQGYTEKTQIIIEDDVWIGRDVLIMPGRRVQQGSIVAGGTVLCKDFPKYSIIGGNPSQLIRLRF